MFDLELLVCPADKKQLESHADYLQCTHCSEKYKVEHGIPVFYVSEDWENQYITDENYYAAEEPFSIEGDTPYLDLRDNNDYGVVLDLGSGDGVYASSASKDVKVYCLDVTPTGLRRIFKRNMDNLIPICASGFELPFEDESIDTILYVFVVEHLEKGLDLKMMQEAKRVLKKDTGRMIYTTDTPFFDRYLVRWTNLLLRGKLTVQDHVSDTGHINLLTMEQSRQLIGKSGFDIVSEEPIIFGARFNVWKKIIKLIKHIMPISIFENFLTSKYAFIVKVKQDSE